MTCVVGRAVCLGYIKVNIIISSIIKYATSNTNIIPTYGNNINKRSFARHLQAN